MTDLSDYKRLVSEPHARAQAAKIRRLKAELAAAREALARLLRPDGVERFVDFSRIETDNRVTMIVTGDDYERAGRALAAAGLPDEQKERR